MPCGTIASLDTADSDCITNEFVAENYLIMGTAAFQTIVVRLD